MRHYNQYREAGSPNIRVTDTSKRSGVAPTNNNSLSPELSDYFSNQGEAEAHLLNAYRDMKNKYGKTDYKTFKKYVNGLKDNDSKKKAISQFASRSDAYKWMQSMPLISFIGATAYVNKEE